MEAQLPKAGVCRGRTGFCGDAGIDRGGRYSLLWQKSEDPLGTPDAGGETVGAGWTRDRTGLAQLEALG